MAAPKFTYVPTLAVRPSEMNGLEQLPGLSKDRMRPVFLLAPWATANSLAKAISRVEKAYSNRGYVLDLDRDYEIPTPSRGPQRELRMLLDPRNCFENWWVFVSEHSNIQPCLQLSQQTIDCIQTQISYAQQLQREFCVRVELKRLPNNLSDVVAALNAVGTSDYFIVIDGGWTTNPESLATPVLRLINGVFEDINAEIPIVVSSTSMLGNFQEIINSEEVRFGNRKLVREITANSNRRYIVYGDWGSTRPREPSSHRQRPLSRIDYPTPNGCVIARNGEERWTFKDAAEEVVHNSGLWNGNLRVWGENMILQTIINPDFGINTPQKNVASRVNIHLHLQAFFGEPGFEDLDFDEDWED